MTQQQPADDSDLLITDAWQLPAGRDETVSVFVNRVLERRDWFAGDTLTCIGEHGAPVLAQGDEVVDGELVTLADDTGRTLLLIVRRLLDFGFGHVTFRVGADGVMRLVEVQLHLRPLSDQDEHSFLQGLKHDVIPRIKQAYGAWWLPGTYFLRLRRKPDGNLQSGCLTFTI